MRKPAHYDGGESANKGAWSKQEDEKLISYIHTNGEGCWRAIPQAAGLQRCGKSCRLRWVNYLKPGLKRGNFSDDEEDLIIKLHALLGNRWSLIAGRLPGRTDNEVKNYWNTHVRRKLLNVGIDPNNHRLKQTLALLKKSNQPQPPKSTRDHVEKMAPKSNTRNEDREIVRVSDSGSCLLEDFNSSDFTTSNNTQLPDLNLDLNLDLGRIKSEAKGICDEDKSMVLRDVEIHNPSSPTLLLFT